MIRSVDAVELSPSLTHQIDKDLTNPQQKSDDGNIEAELRPYSLQVYPRRWVILLIVGTAIALRGYNQSCYGPTNNVYSEYYRIRPWQVDWLVVVQSVVFLVISFPMTLLTTKIGFRRSVIIITITQTIGFILTVLGVSWRSTFWLVLIGQGIMGFSNIISWSIPPATAAIWFPQNEVATAVALQVVGRGIGEAIGSFLPTVLLKYDSSAEQTKESLVSMFSCLGAVAFCLTLASFFFVSNAPLTPPSEAQAKILMKNEETENTTISTLKQFLTILKALFTNKVFIAVWFVFGAINPILRNNNILLTSILHKRFNSNTKINLQSGVVLLVAWSLYTVGGFIAGPLITKTKAYKWIVVFSIFSLAATCSVILVGVRFEALYCVYAAVAIQGLFVGMANTSLFELIAEVTYPVPPMFVTMVAIVILGLFRLTFPLIGRLLLLKAGPTWATTFPVFITILSGVITVAIKPTYNREMANKAIEERPLININTKKY